VLGTGGGGMSGGTAGSARRPTGTPYYTHPPLIWVLWAPVHWQEALLPGLRPFQGQVAWHGGDAPPPQTGTGRDAMPCGAGPLTPAPGPCGAAPLTPATRSRIARCVA